MKQNYYVAYTYANGRGGLTKGNQFIGVVTGSTTDLLKMQTVIDIALFLSDKYVDGKNESVLIDFIFRIADGEPGADHAPHIQNITQQQDRD